MKSYLRWFALLLVSALVLSSCKKDDSNPVTPPAATHASGSYVGMITGANESGVLSISVGTPAKSVVPNHAFAVINLTGTLTFGGTSIGLTGTYDTADDSLFITGGGYSFVGTYSHGVVIGSYTGPNGPGGFSTQSSSGADTVKVYLGSAQSQVAGNSGARLNIVVKGSKLLGLAVGTDGGQTPFSGTVTGNTISIGVSYAGATAHLADGTFNADHTSASGTYNTSSFQLTDPDHGTWSVAIAH